MPEFSRDEFGRLRDGDANLRAGPSSHYSSRESRPQSSQSINKSDRRGEEEPHYGPSSHEKVDTNIFPGLVIHGEVIRIESYGAFVSFRDRLQRHQKGLIHISQLASHRVESVTDVLKINQPLHAVVLEVEYDQRIGKRIRLSLKDVDQRTGKYSGRDLINGSRAWGAKGGGRRPSAHELQLRAKSRREMLFNLDRHWKNIESNPISTQNGVKSKGENADKPHLYLRKLWSSSPLRSNKEDNEPLSNKESCGGCDYTDSASDGSSHSSSSAGTNSSFSESYESDRQRRRKAVRRRQNSSNQSRRKSRKRKRSSKSKKNRRRSPSSSSNTSTSSSSRASTSSNEIERQDDKNIKSEGDINQDDVEKNAINDLKDFDFKEAQAFKKAMQRSNFEEEEEGPMPLQQSSSSGGGGGDGDGNASYGKALLPGEGQALAQYVQQNLRIPRRGEIGFSGDDIELWEHSGYVMSGSRHTRMNAVRIRKENQVYSAEEQRALALLTMEENQQKEAQLMEDFRTMLKEKKKMRDEGK